MHHLPPRVPGDVKAHVRDPPADGVEARHPAVEQAPGAVLVVRGLRGYDPPGRRIWGGSGSAGSVLSVPTTTVLSARASVSEPSAHE